MRSLDLVPSGTEVIVKEIQAGCGLRFRLYGIGIIPGEKLKVIKNDRGPILLKVGNAKLAIGKGAAKKILVEVT